MNSENSKIRILEEILGRGEYNRSSQEILFYCPFCKHHKKKLSVNLSNGYYKCWVCETAGKKIINLIKRFADKNEVQRFCDVFETTYTADVKADIQHEDFKIELPEGFFSIYTNPDQVFSKKAIEYLVKYRGVEMRDLLRYKIGISNLSKWMDGIIFPSFDKRGHLNYYTVRFYNGEKKLPFTYRGYKNDIIINELNLDFKKPLVVVEGFIDMLKSVRNTTPLFGSSLNKESKLFSEIVSNNTCVILALDSDAQHKTNKIAETFLEYDIEVFGINLGKYKDVGEMSKEEFKTRYENAFPIQKNNIFVNKLNNLR